ncbi:MAG: hypothetical protein R3F05_19875 [Planctomycetota bacterium]
MAAIALIAGGLAGWLGYASSRDLLRAAAFHHLTSLRESRARCVEGWFEALRRTVSTLAESPSTRDALDAFRSALAAGADGGAQLEADVRDWYAAQLMPRFGAGPAPDAGTQAPPRRPQSRSSMTISSPMSTPSAARTR